MKFLFLYKYIPEYSFDGWFHLDLVDHYTKHGHESMSYGPRVHQAYNNAVCEYNEDITLSELWEKFQFDVVVCLTQSRMFDYYRPAKVEPIAPERKEGCWIPKDFKVWKGKKVVIEEDFHYEDNTDWYKEMEINLVLQRHYSNVKRFNDIGNQDIPCVWLPFSVDENIFRPNNLQRINKLSLVGSATNHIYPHRVNLVKKLESANLIDKHERKVGVDYLKTLNEYTVTACCSSIYDITPAKIFEIMASGSVLFTNEGNYGLEKLFDKDSYICYTDNNVEEKIITLLGSSHIRKYISDKAREQILQKHTHEIRIKEMVNLIRSIL